MRTEEFGATLCNELHDLNLFYMRLQDRIDVNRDRFTY